MNLPIIPNLTTQLKQVAYLGLLLTLLTAQAATIFWSEPVAEVPTTDQTEVEDGLRQSAASAAEVAQADFTLDATRVADTLDLSSFLTASTSSPDTSLELAANSPIQTAAGTSGEAEYLAILGTTFETAVGTENPADQELASLPIEEAVGTGTEASEGASQNDGTNSEGDGEPADSSPQLLIAAPIPEPSSGVLALCGALSFACARRRSRNGATR